MDLELILRKMVEDKTYVPPIDLSTKGRGLPPGYRKIKEKLRAEIPNFDELLLRNITYRKKQKLKQKLKDDPEYKEREMAKKAERRRRRRAQKVGDKVKLTPREKYLNFQQSLITRQLNDKIKKNPSIITNNEKLMKDLSTTVSKEGDIIRVNPNLSEITNRGLYEIEHQRDIFKKGAMKDFPYNRNLILGPHNRSGGFKAMAEKFIENNPDSPKVNNILEKAEELKITLQPNVPEGTFKTKGLGFKQPTDPVEKFKLVATEITPELADQKLGVPSYGKDLEMAKRALGFAGKKLSIPVVAALTGYNILNSGEAQAEEPIKYNDEIGAFVNPQTDDKVSQATMLDWAANNPMPTAAVASAPLLSKTVRKGAGKLLSGLLSTLGSSTAGLGFAGLTVKENLDEGKNIVDATVDPLVGAELLFPEAAKRFGGKGLQNALGRALSLGRVGAMMTPVGIGITGLGIGKELYNVAQEEQDRINAMTPEEKLEYFAEQQELMDVSA
jgi:hypothetical protein